jgi:AcrR family transcriptional regulator
LLEAAVALFNERGYGAVSLDEIGAAVGMAGPSIYHHFATKADLLVSAFMRAANWLAGPGGAAPVEPSHPRALMEMLVQRYVDLAVSHRDLFGVYLSEAVNLPPEAGRRIASALRSDVDQWTESLVAMRPGLPPVQARLLVLAARGAVTDVVRLGLFLERPGIAAEIGEIVFAVLGADPAPG